ncbi:MAG: 2-amino-4-hydroxy-6-hydroxymethyldihydropteridine diphosphokinase [Jatrophihabitans sp.]|uniref:2-amino-4-hydroxy-6- hydroxymethyldihydropteridine diphosphokinase n=1 Tax=Jatrophihabitans sp. TaxID=1932789 RepID=UPI003F813468
MSSAVLSIGSNLGDRMAMLHLAVDAVRPWLVGVSPVFETAPWGDVPQDDFLNAILLVDDPDAAPQDWLERGQAVETASGRVREVRWGPRTLDVDVVDVPGVVSDDPLLTLPHPRAAERAFVLVPWLALDGDATLGARPVRDLIAALDADEVTGVRRRDDLVLA